MMCMHDDISMPMRSEQQHVGKLNDTFHTR